MNVWGLRRPAPQNRPRPAPRAQSGKPFRAHCRSPFLPRHAASPPRAKNGRGVGPHRKYNFLSSTSRLLRATLTTSRVLRNRSRRGAQEALAQLGG